MSSKFRTGWYLAIFRNIASYTGLKIVIVGCSRVCRGKYYRLESDMKEYGRKGKIERGRKWKIELIREKEREREFVATTPHYHCEKMKLMLRNTKQRKKRKSGNWRTCAIGTNYLLIVDVFLWSFILRNLYG